MSAAFLKIFATIAMVLDHFGVMFSDILDPSIFRIIGRLAFPIYAFLTAESCRHTRDIKKYAKRLFIFAATTEAAFRIVGLVFAKNNPSFLSQNINILFTLFLAVIMVIFYQNAEKSKNMLLYLPIIGIFIIAAIFPFDYGVFGVALILVFYVFSSNKPIQFAAAALTIAAYAFDYISSGLNTYSILMFCFTLGSLILIYFYNGKKGMYINKWIFYLIYPGQFVVLFILHEIVLMIIR